MTRLVRVASCEGPTRPFGRCVRTSCATAPGDFPTDTTVTERRQTEGGVTNRYITTSPCHNRHRIRGAHHKSPGVHKHSPAATFPCPTPGCGRTPRRFNVRTYVPVDRLPALPGVAWARRPLLGPPRSVRRPGALERAARLRWACLRASERWNEQ